MKWFKKIIQHILLYLLKKLNMPAPFTYFTNKDMTLIFGALLNFVDTLEGTNFNLHNLPELVYNSNIVTGKSADYGTLELTSKTNGQKSSINISNDYEVLFINIDNNTSTLITDIVKGYLKKNKFIQ